MPLESTSEWLRALPSLTGEPRRIALHQLPDDPADLFLNWIQEAVQRGVPEPHAATLATVDAGGVPDARTLILKGVDENGWSFAGHRASHKSQQLAANPSAALNFWWQPIVRAVRVRGVVHEATRAESDADLLARSAAAREGVEPGDWVLWRLAPSRIEFWNGSVDRRHTRIRYVRDSEEWSSSVTGGERDGDVDIERRGTE
jgi:pyridoxamine 5'-phosphate oxidase